MDSLHRDTQPLSKNIQPFIPTFGYAASCNDHFPDVRSTENNRPPTGWTVTEYDPRVTIQSHSLIDITLGEPHGGFTTLVASPTKRIECL